MTVKSTIILDAEFENPLAQFKEDYTIFYSKVGPGGS